MFRHQTANSASALVSSSTKPALDTVSSLLPSALTEIVPKVAVDQLIPDVNHAKVRWNQGVVSARDFVASSVQKLSADETKA
jgi:hypothetical protein